MAKLVFLPLFIESYLADTTHLTDAEHGRYLLLLMLMWRTPGCRIPNDDQWLARRFNRSVKRVRAELRPIISEFMQSDGNWITQKRLTREFTIVTKTHELRSESAKSRWRNKNDSYRAHAPIPTQESYIGESQSRRRRKKNSEVIAEATTRNRTRTEH